MLKILIVDDEEIIRDGIAMKLNNLVPHAQITGMAEDAHQALEMVESNCPDVIITDIRMPEMDGLQLIEKIKNKYPAVRFILVSGYQDFEYARKGLELGAENYLLKPIENEKLKEAIERLEKKIGEESHSRSYLQELKQKARDNLDYIRNKYLNDAVNHSGEFDIELTMKALEKVGVSFGMDCFTVVSIVVRNLACLPGFSGKQDAELAKFAIRNVAEEVLSRTGTVVAFDSLRKDNQVVVILNHTKASQKAISAACGELMRSLEKYLGLSASIGIGRSCDSAALLRDSYTESYHAAMQSMIVGDGSIIHIDSVPDSNLITFFMPENERLLLFSYINSRNLEKAFEVVDNVFSVIRARSLSYTNVKALCIDISIMLGKAVKDSGGSWENIFDEDIFTDDYISRFTTLDQLNKWLKECINSICNYLFELRKSDGKKAIEEIKEYINNYYYTEINFNELSNKYFINSSYLSQLFKNETGEKLIDYLTRVRMEKAKELLSSTSLKSYEIAQMVGYSDSRYFSNVFTKYSGVNPTKYREQQ